MTLLVVCAVGGRGCAGWFLGGLRASQIGAAAAALALLACVDLSSRLCDLRLKELLDRFLNADVGAEAATEAMLAAVTLYQATVFPLTLHGVNAAERDARRSAAYRMAADENLPRPAQVAAAAALEAIDVGDAKTTSAELFILRPTTRAYRVGWSAGSGGSSTELDSNRRGAA
ncbi:hypothetical protein [Streptomyces sp. NBC_00687]|uniref:hypothetical protein n=1 Tax=Streptomyces sp. NBC_00687 TaxID=2975807 RepID=UPI0022539E8F|nr:hypothetical protein [Streptomyces sp. NBC_00687]MCX4919003.1 hypothetical protein [Streptomyces sp. NBC_00687]